jgi:hypothetical protein
MKILDEVLPDYADREVHGTAIAASAEETWRAMQAVTVRDRRSAVCSSPSARFPASLLVTPASSIIARLAPSDRLSRPEGSILGDGPIRGYSWRHGRTAL